MRFYHCYYGFLSFLLSTAAFAQEPPVDVYVVYQEIAPQAEKPQSGEVWND